jgi:hypothetical protein
MVRLCHSAPIDDAPTNQPSIMRGTPRPLSTGVRSSYLKRGSDAGAVICRRQKPSGSLRASAGSPSPPAASMLSMSEMQFDTAACLSACTSAIASGESSD